jgi:site-specific DNA-adenine methylase
VPQLRALQALSSGPRTSGDLGHLAGACNALLALRLVDRTVIDLDGRKESLWVIGDAGVSVLSQAAAVNSGAQRKDRSDEKQLRVGALVPWFGSARRTADACVAPLRGCNWVGVPFAGSLAEVPAIFAAGVRDVMINDAHRHLVNLARVAACPVLGPELWRRLRRQPFCQEVLAEAQKQASSSEPGSELDLNAAFSYFITAWAGRSGNAGTQGELSGNLAARWDSGGGNSALRFSGAAWSLRAWRNMLQRCTFFCMDALDFLSRVKDKQGVGVYSDPPWPETGSCYKHGYQPAFHRVLAARLAEFKHARVVIRSGDDSLTKQLYPESSWAWKKVLGRTQGNTFSGEWVIVNQTAGATAAEGKL